MSTRKIKLNEDDLKSFLGLALQSSGYMQEGQKIVGFEYRTRDIKREGDYYKDGMVRHADVKVAIADCKCGCAAKVELLEESQSEEVRWVKVVVDTSERRRKEEPAEPEDGE
jgi:hypothetical protein